MATKSKVVESAYRIGCGRYIQEDGAIGRLGEEIERLKCNKPLIIGDGNTLKVAKDKIEASLIGRQHKYLEYVGFCNPDRCERVVKDELEACDIIVGVGGGVICDTAKLCASIANIPIITIPTSSATCAACVPSSVMYDDDGRTIGTRHHKCEVNCVLADMEILTHQPARLFTAGVYDSMAKLLEIRQRILGKDESEIDIGLRSSFEVSKFLYDRLKADFDASYNDIINKRNTKAVYDSVYLTLCLTGAVSGLARGSNQTAIAHKVYESLRALYPFEARRFLHGELVALGLIAQLYFNGYAEDAVAFKKDMEQRNVITSLSALNIKDENMLDTLYNKMLSSSAMAGTDEIEHIQLKKALNMIL